MIASYVFDEKKTDNGPTMWTFLIGKSGSFLDTFRSVEDVQPNPMQLEQVYRCSNPPFRKSTILRFNLHGLVSVTDVHLINDWSLGGCSGLSILAQTSSVSLCSDVQHLRKTFGRGLKQGWFTVKTDILTPSRRRPAHRAPSPFMIHIVKLQTVVVVTTLRVCSTR